MNWIAIKMLVGDRAKYLGIVFGVTFASLLIAHQASIFCGVLRLTVAQIEDVKGADLWVMDPEVQFVDDVKPLSENDLYRVRGVEGVEWAVRLYKGLARARLESGNFQQIILLGLDDDTLIGAPEIVVGSLADLRRPDAVIMDERGYRYLWPNQPYELGKTFEMNDRRAVLVGVCKASRTFQTFPIIYSRYSQATQYVPRERKLMSFVMAQPVAGADAHAVCQRIREQTGLQALTRHDFLWKTILYYLQRTGIPMNFGITVMLGFVVGTAISGQTFYLFTVENLKQFGALKSMGVTDGRIIGMVLLQAALVGVIGYGLGVGLAALFGKLTESSDRIAYFMNWPVLVITGLAVMVIMFLASLLSIRRLVVLEPAIVFRG
jgi:putative ABC transport system permease protein